MDAKPIAGLEQALDATGQLVAGVREEQWSDPTPCDAWNVRELVGHVVGGNLLFAGILCGEPPRTPGSDLSAAYGEAAGELLAAFSRPGALEGTYTVPFGTVPGAVVLDLRITELLVHGWDLARATGQPTGFPDGLAERELEFSRGALSLIPADRQPFKPEQATAPDASAIDRLAALLGRSVATA